MDKKKKRWKLAQNSETAWWRKQIAYLKFDYFQKFSEELIKESDNIFEITQETRILEIGSGPAGILTHLNSQKRFAVDPLERFYCVQKACKEYRDPQVKYSSAQGEYLPFIDNCFDFLIIDNILDHCEDIDLFFQEAGRVLVPNGVIYLRNFTHTLWGVVLARFLEIFKIDRGHPYNFTKSDLEKILQKNSLKTVKCKGCGFLKHFFRLMSARKISHYLRALSFTQSDKVTFILVNEK